LKSKISLRKQLIIIIVVFVVLMLSLIYLFQTAFIDDFYKKNKSKVLKEVANEVANVIEGDDVDQYLERAIMTNEVCIRVVSNNALLNNTGACALRNIDINTINQITNDVSEETNKEKLFDNFRFNGGPDVGVSDMFVYGKLINYDNNDILILVSSMITPLTSTIQTLKAQYVGIAIMVVLASIVLALILSKILIKPIKLINQESINLPKGEYDKDKVKTNNQEYSELNETLANANDQILKADRAKKELLGNVSHDLRTPLTMIVGYGEMIRDLPEENNKDNIEVIINEAKRLSTLVDDLIDISKLESNKIELHKEDISLNKLLKSVYKQYSVYCKAQKVKFELNTVDDITINVDENRIKQVLYNFINNALNYNTNKKPKIILGSEIVDGKYRVYVYDNGEGINDKDINNIWDRYYKVDKEHKRHHIGSGIGLSLSKDLLIAHNLGYGVESKIGEYSKFYFDI